MPFLGLFDVVPWDDIEVPNETSIEEIHAGQKKYRYTGSLEGKITISEDFDVPLEDMKDYL